MTKIDAQNLTPDSLGKAIKFIRNEKGMNLKDVSAKSGMSVSYLSDIERDRTLPSLDTLGRIAKAMDHHLFISMRETDEVDFPCSEDEIELLYALRLGDFNRFVLMAAAILNKSTLDQLQDSDNQVQP